MDKRKLKGADRAPPKRDRAARAEPKRDTQVSVRLTPAVFANLRHLSHEVGLEHSIVARLLVLHATKYCEAHGISYLDFIQRLAEDTISGKSIDEKEATPDPHNFVEFVLRHTYPARAQAHGYKAVYDVIRHHPFAQKILGSSIGDTP